jgi:hypothetical protein
MLNCFVDTIRGAPGQMEALLEALADADWVEALELYAEPEFLAARFPDPDEGGEEAEPVEAVGEVGTRGRRPTHPELRKPGWMRQHPSMYFATFTRKVLSQAMLPPDERKGWAKTASVHEGTGALEFDAEATILVIFRQKVRVQVDQLPLQTLPEGRGWRCRTSRTWLYTSRVTVVR